jgi:hypothetical protein
VKNVNFLISCVIKSGTSGKENICVFENIDSNTVLSMKKKKIKKKKNEGKRKSLCMYMFVSIQ